MEEPRKIPESLKRYTIDKCRAAKARLSLSVDVQDHAKNNQSLTKDDPLTNSVAAQQRVTFARVFVSCTEDDMQIPKAFHIHHSIRRKAAIPLMLGTLIFALIMIHVVSTLQMQSVEQQAIQQAAGVHAQFVETEALLAERQQLARHLVHQVSERLNQRGLMQIRLISSSPLDPDRVPQSAWEQDALVYLYENPQDVQTHLVTAEGESHLLYMTPVFASAEYCVICHNSIRQGTPQEMSKLCQSCHTNAHRGESDREAGSCTDCHTSHNITVSDSTLVPEDNVPAEKEQFDEIALGDMLGALVIEVPLTDALATAQRRTIWMSLGILAGLTGFVGFILYFENRAVVRPVRELAQAARQLAGGDTAVELSVQSEDEIGQMARAFDGLIDYIKEMASAATQLSEGNLTSEITPQSDRDVLGNAFARMMTNLRHLIGQVSDSANAVGIASGQLSTVADQTSQATSQVAAAIHQVAQGIAQQTKSVTSAAATVRQMTEAVDSVSRGALVQADSVAQFAQNATRISSAVQQVNDSVRRMESVREMVKLSAQKVQEMDNRSRQIGVITQTLDDIAAQTNILALNAAIEAAQAKEYGKSFAVVANEVRKLAQNSGQATQEIAALIRAVQRAIGEAVSAMEKTFSEVDQQVAEISTVTQQMIESSSELMSTMDTVSAVVEENTAITEEMAIEADDVSRTIESIAGISEESRGTAAEVSAAVQQVGAQAEEVTASTQSLDAMARQLQALVAQFELPTDLE